MVDHDEDRALIEQALRLVLTHAPTAWERVRLEFGAGRAATASATIGRESSVIGLPDQATHLLTQYCSRPGRPRGRTVVECDDTGAVAIRAEPLIPQALPAQATSIESPKCISSKPALGGRHLLMVRLWAVAAVAAMALLVVAIVGRDQGEGPTLRALAAGESMSDEQARTIADTTVRVWVRERNERHLANLEALSVAEPADIVARELGEIKAGRPFRKEIRVLATGALTRRGAVWGLNTHLDDQSLVFVMRIEGGELRVWAVGSALTP